MKVCLDWMDGCYSLRPFADGKYNDPECFRAPDGTAGAIEIDDAVIVAWVAHLAQARVFNLLFAGFENEQERRDEAKRQEAETRAWRERCDAGDPTAIAQGEQ